MTRSLRCSRLAAILLGAGACWTGCGSDESGAGALATGGSSGADASAGGHGGAGQGGGAGHAGASQCGDAGASISVDAGALGTTASISQWGVSFQFDKEYPYGQFANGDYWVVGPVSIIAMSPSFDGAMNGWQVNPLPGDSQGFDSRVNDFDATLVPALPYQASGGQSIVKGVSNPDACPSGHTTCLTTAAVLTVLDAAPASAVFRPPYVGAAKPLYTVQQLETQCLPSLAPVDGAPTLETIRTTFERVQLDHKPGWTGRDLHPMSNMPDYGSQIATSNAEGALRLLLNDSLDAKAPALIAYVQAGIDTYHMAVLGQTWAPDGGHSFGRKLLIAFAGVLLADTSMQQLVRQAANDAFAENGSIYSSPAANNGQGQVLYGQGDVGEQEEIYWHHLVDSETTGSKTIPDPYGYIDGGMCPGCGYDFCCTVQPFKATALAARLVPGLRDVWNDERFFAYVTRWVDVGTWAQPDPCAPPDGTCSGGTSAGTPCSSALDAVCGEAGVCDLTVNWATHYGVTYGPDGKGGCILDTDASDGTGRFPQKHGAAKDDGYYGSAFANAMFKAYGPL